MLDTHAHLTSPLFSPDFTSVLSRASTAGLTSIITVSTTLADAHSVLSLCTTHPLLHPALGLHPSHVTTLSPLLLSTTLSQLSNLLHLHSPTLAAIGEVGLDFTPYVLSQSPTTPASARTAQQETFAHFLRLSRQLSLPITAHSRGAGRHALDLVNESATHGPVRVVMHAFDGRAVYAERALDNVKEGLYFSIPPCVVRSEQLGKLVRRMPLERLLLESDAPALGVEVGARNEPAEVSRVVEMIAALKGVDVDMVREVVGQNERALFPRLFGR